MTHTCDIFYKSYAKDFWLLKISLESLNKNVTGYNNIVILIPENEKELFDTRDMPERALIFYVPEYGAGWLYQQVCKLSAHKYCFAEFIMFADSDCIFTYPIDLQEFVKDGKPEILYTDWSKVGEAIAWKKPTEDLMGEEVLWEFMRRNCLIYYRETLVNISTWKSNLELLVMSSARFSEYNLIGAWAFKNENHNYSFVNTEEWTYVPPKAEQLWSHATKQKGASETHHLEYIRTLETILKANGIKIPNE